MIYQRVVHLFGGLWLIWGLTRCWWWTSDWEWTRSKEQGTESIMGGNEKFFLCVCLRMFCFARFCTHLRERLLAFGKIICGVLLLAFPAGCILLKHLINWSTGNLTCKALNRSRNVSFRQASSSISVADILEHLQETVRISQKLSRRF
jgi:hypothetical protein